MSAKYTFGDTEFSIYLLILEYSELSFKKKITYTKHSFKKLFLNLIKNIDFRMLCKLFLEI